MYEEVGDVVVVEDEVFFKVDYTKDSIVCQCNRRCSVYALNRDDYRRQCLSLMMFRLITILTVMSMMKMVS